MKLRVESMPSGFDVYRRQNMKGFAVLLDGYHVPWAIGVDTGEDGEQAAVSHLTLDEKGKADGGAITEYGHVTIMLPYLDGSGIEVINPQPPLRA